MKRLLLVSVVLPILGLIALIGRAELNLRGGRPWVLPITGYDPRDLLSGHYIRYRYDLQWDGLDSCGDQPGAIDPACCLCLQPREGTREPWARNVACSDVDRCLSWVPGSAAAGEQRFFVPAERGAALEAAIRSRSAAILASITTDGTLAVDTLLLDGKPWQEVLDATP